MRSAHLLVATESGEYLSLGHDGVLKVGPRVDDWALWKRAPDGSGLIHLEHDQYWTVAALATRPEVGGSPGQPASLTIVPGPTLPPSHHLATLRSRGFTVIDEVISPTDIGKVKHTLQQIRQRDHSDEPPTDGHFWIMTGLAESAEIARAVAHPVALWLIEQYLAAPGIHLCHQPVATTIKPSKELVGTFPEGGWHTDYPYHPGQFPDDRWPNDPKLGVQFNICLDPFTPESGGTQYLPMSHLLGRWPDDEFNQGGTQMGHGVHSDIVQMRAEAGSALIYDSRTWHRACNELNLLDRDRQAILNAVAPSYVPEMMDKGPVGDQYQTGPVPDQLTARERADITTLCLTSAGHR